MKKTFLIALAGMMLFAFTQCNKGSKEFQDTKAGIKEMTKAVQNAKACEDIEKAVDEVVKKYADKKYEDKDKMTKEEEEKIKKMTEEMEKVTKETTEKLCK